MAVRAAARRGRPPLGAAFAPYAKTNGRCRSASTVKMSSFLFLLPHSLMPQTDGVERRRRGGGGDGENGEKRRIKEKGLHQATAARVCPITALHPAQAHERTSPRREAEPRRVAEACLQQSFLLLSCRAFCF